MSSRMSYVLGAIFALLAAPSTATVTTMPCDLAAPAFDGLDVQCAGFFAGNVANNSPGARAIRDDVATILGVQPFGLSDARVLNVTDNGTTSTIHFATPVSGQALVALDFSVIGSLRNQSAFYLISFDRDVSALTLPYTRLTATMYQTQTVVPEPATWALTLIGFLMIGRSVRRNGPTSRLTQVA